MKQFSARVCFLHLLLVDLQCLACVVYGVWRCSNQSKFRSSVDIQTLSVAIVGGGQELRSHTQNDECSKVDVEKKQLSKNFFPSTTKWKCLNIKQNTQILFFKWHDPWILSRFEIKWVNIYSDNLNNFAQVFVVRNILSLHSLVHVS